MKRRRWVNAPVVVVWSTSLSDPSRQIEARSEIMRTNLSRRETHLEGQTYLEQGFSWHICGSVDEKIARKTICIHSKLLIDTRTSKKQVQLRWHFIQIAASNSQKTARNWDFPTLPSHKSAFYRIPHALLVFRQDSIGMSFVCECMRHHPTPSACMATARDEMIAAWRSSNSSSNTYVRSPTTAACQPHTSLIFISLKLAFAFVPSIQFFQLTITCRPKQYGLHFELNRTRMWAYFIFSLFLFRFYRFRFWLGDTFSIFVVVSCA